MKDPVDAAAAALDPSLDKVLTACKEKLSAPTAWSAFPGYPDSLALAVLDAIWSVGIRYTTTQGVVTRYTMHRRFAGSDAAHDSLTDLLGLYDRLGGVDTFITTVGTLNRVSTQPGAALKGEAVHQAATALQSLGIDTAQQFRQAQGTDLGTQAETAWRAVPGQGSGISWRYLRMLLGIADVKPDRMVKRFIATALGTDEQQFSNDKAIRLVQAAAAHHGVEQHALDHEIWKYQTSTADAQAQGTQAEQLTALATALADRAFAVLKEQRVLPVSAVQPFIRVGRDYQGSDVMGQPEFQELESALNTAYPQRFADPLQQPEPEFADHYVLSFLEAAIARCARRDGAFTADSAAVATSAAELVAVLDSEEYTVHCCRAVSHIATAGNEPVRVGEVTVIPETASRDLIRQTQTLIPAVGTAFGGNVPFLYAPPHALLVSTVTARRDENPYAAGRRASAQIDRFTFLARLLHAGTLQPSWEVTGSPTLIAQVNPRHRTFGTGRPDSRLQRTVHLSPDNAPAFTALSAFIDAAAVKREGMVTTSFDTAVHRYNRAHEIGDDFEHIVDLTTALEAVLTGSESDHEALSLRLKSRTAALLATETDTGTSIFNDVNKLYGLRSSLVHGGRLRETDLRKAIAVSTVPENAMFGVALAFAVDRLRDLVRRSFLARLCLAAGAAPLWPFSSVNPIDIALADDTTRPQWRAHWRDQLHALGAGAAADPATPGIDPITRRSQP
jgi:hypothetical protein